MPHPVVRRFALALAAALPFWLAACAVPQAPPPEMVAVTPPVPPPVAPVAPVVRISPVEVEPLAPATQPASLFVPSTQGPVAATLQYAEKARAMTGNELQAELARLGDPGDAPAVQMQVALLLAQTRAPADLARAAGMLQRVVQSPSVDAMPLQPLARTLVARYLEQRRVEDERDRQAAQVRDAQRRIDQLNDRIEALRAIERSFARPAASAPARPAP